MASFFRLNQFGTTVLGEVSRLGWRINDMYQIPDDYIERGNFLIMRMCNGLGDWGIISAMPRLLKTKYPHCKVYVPSSKLLQKIFGDSLAWKHWPNPHLHTELIFNNNPYVDDFIDDITDEVFHDHYRIYDDNINTPLIKQMLRFWGFKDEECIDLEPELYFTEEEKILGNNIIEKFFGKEEFGGFICTSSQLKKGEFFDDDRNNKIINELKQNNFKYVYYGGVDIQETPFKNYINVILDFNQVPTPLKIQLYIRSKAKINIGYQSSIFELICRYTPILCTEMIGGSRENFFPIIKYL